MPSEVLQICKCCYNGHFCTIAHKHVMLAILVDKNTPFKVVFVFYLSIYTLPTQTGNIIYFVMKQIY